MTSSPECGDRLLQRTAHRLDRWFRCAGPTEPKSPSLANMGHERWPEADKTNACSMAHARINQTEGSNQEESLTQSLRDLVAGWIECRGEFPADPQVVKLTCEIGEVFVVGHLILELSNLGERDGRMVYDFRLGRLNASCSVPGAARRAAEPCSGWVGMGECRIDDARIRNVCDELLWAYSGKQAQFSFQPFVGPAFCLKEFTENVFIGSQTGKHALFFRTVLGLNEPACVLECDGREKRESICPPASLMLEIDSWHSFTLLHVGRPKGGGRSALPAGRRRSCTAKESFHRTWNCCSEAVPTRRQAPDRARC